MLHFRVLTHIFILYSRKFCEHCGSQTGTAESSHLWDVMQCSRWATASALLALLSFRTSHTVMQCEQFPMLCWHYCPSEHHTLWCYVSSSQCSVGTTVLQNITHCDAMWAVPNALRALLSFRTSHTVMQCEQFPMLWGHYYPSEHHALLVQWYSVSAQKKWTLPNQFSSAFFTSSPSCWSLTWWMKVATSGNAPECSK